MRSLRILVAEDESLIRLGLRRILEESGHQVTAAPDGRAAVKLARQIHARRPLPIVLLTAYGDRELVEQAADLPIMAYLMKPVNEHELLATLQVVMARFDEQQQVLRHAVGLEEQLATRKLVDRAKGVLMAREGLSENDAYQRIQRQARQERRSMRQVAQAILRQARD